MNMNTKIEELLAVLKKKEDDKQKNTVLWVLAIIGAVAAVAGIAFAVYRFFTLRIIWRILKKISMTISTIILRMRKNKNRQLRLIPGLFSCRSAGQRDSDFSIASNMPYRECARVSETKI